MLPKRFYKIFGIRVELFKLGGATYYNWDKKTETLTPAHDLYIANMWAGFYGGGLMFIGSHLLYMYMKNTFQDIPEDGQIGEKPVDLKDFATSMIEAGEVLLVICLALLNLVFLQRRDIFQLLFNDLLNYNKKLSEMIDEGKFTPTDDHKMIVRFSELLIYLVMAFSMVLPFFVVASCMTKIEPTNRLIREFLEVDFQFNLAFAPFLVMFVGAAYGVGTTVSLMAQGICLYWMTTVICTEAITPEAYLRQPHLGTGRCKLKTACCGLITDTEVIHLYRIQQVFNTLMGAFFKSVLISFHQVGVLATAVVLLVFLIRYNEVLSEHGPMGYVVVVSCMIAPLIMIYYQAKMGGAVVDISEDFKFSGTKFIPRRMMFRKFTYCCTTFFIEVAYPFYTIHKETFAEFMQQVQDYSMEFLCW